MKGIKGQLSSLPVTDLMQWIDMNKKSGVLLVSGDGSTKCFCFEGGKLLMGSSNDPGSTLGDFLAREGHVQPDIMRKAVADAKDSGGSLMGYMVEKKLIPLEFLRVSVQQLAEESMTDILSWENGSFEFIENLPGYMSGSPVALNTGFIVFESVRKHDEIMKQLGLKQS